MKRALITGITGQDGRYLAGLLASKGYQVFGLVRGQNNPKSSLVLHETPSLELVDGDLRDLSSLIAVVERAQPDEVYNLGAISFVHLSFTQAELTSEITGLGVLRMLEAVRIVGGVDNNPIRFYQASSSEMFGKVRETPQNELTAFHPRSPYGVAKVFGHHMTVNYREAYGLHASSGILFNHESVPGSTPVLVREHGYVDILPIEELVPHDPEPEVASSHTLEGGDLEVWDGECFSRCTARSANWRSGETVTVHGRGGIVEATPDHVVFTREGEKPAAEIEVGDHLVLGEQGLQVFNTRLTADEAWLLGILAAGGHIAPEGSGRITGGDPGVLEQVEVCWGRVAGGHVTKRASPTSAVDPDESAAAINLEGNRPYLKMLRHELFTPSGTKRVPKRVLNATPIEQEHFLSGYRCGDGVPAGHGIDAPESFRTTSPTLAAGLTWLLRTTVGRPVMVRLEPDALSGRSSYLIDARSSIAPGPDGTFVEKHRAEVRKVERNEFSGWTYDLATESGRFAAGVGFVVVHNSPRRGLEFVTRKITNSLARIKLGLQDSITLGNLESARDWGYAGDYVEAMWLMLQQDEPDDYVVATGETHTIREFLDEAFRCAGYDDWTRYVKQDPRFERPAEVDLLMGDASKARERLGWEPKVDFKDLVRRMYESDLAEESARSGARQ